MSILRRIVRLVRVDYVPRILDVVGMGCIVAAAFIAFGLAPALVTTGVALLIAGWASE
ncbi:hypothetical protein LCGC14_2814480 [marine sediment metagenome]|uniref:Uncharacterized protein n=1 Tax=marine sediment metagenome TaxID=412755 RepID=A0A0F8YIX1_9ZZZZ